MKRNPFENLKKIEVIVKNSYRRWKKKLSLDEVAGHALFMDLIDSVTSSERFLVKEELIREKHEERDLIIQCDDVCIEISDAKLDLDPFLKGNMRDLTFDACAAFSAPVNSSKYIDMFVHFSKDDDDTSMINVFAVSGKFLDIYPSCENFKSFLRGFLKSHRILSVTPETVSLFCIKEMDGDQASHQDMLISVATHVSSIILDRSNAHGGQRYARISDCNFVRGPNGRYEAQNHYTYICEHSDANQFRNSVREKRQAHGFTGMGGTKAFHYKKAHWRYYQELDRDVFVRGYYAGRHKPEVNVIR